MEKQQLLNDLSHVLWEEEGFLACRMVQMRRDTLYICCPYGIGDTLYVCGFVKALKHFSPEVRRVCIVVKSNHADLPEYFPSVDEYMVFNDFVEILHLYAVTTEHFRLKNFLYGHFKCGFDGHLFQEYHDVSEKNMIYRYRKLVMGLPDEAMLEKAVIPESAEECHAEIDKQTIILMPYAASCATLPDYFWETMVFFLQRAGFRIYTNVKDRTEAPVKGTAPLCENLKTMVSICRNSLAVISIRSGLCDLLAITDAVLFVIDTEPKHREWKLSFLTDRENMLELECFEEEQRAGVLENILYILGISSSEHPHGAVSRDTEQECSG